MALNKNKSNLVKIRKDNNVLSDALNKLVHVINNESEDKKVYSNKKNKD